MGIYIAANVPWVPGLFPVGKTAGGWLRLTHPVLVLRLCVGRAVPVSSLCAFMPLSRVTFTLPVSSSSVFSPKAGFGRNQSPVRRPVWLWHTAF